MTRASKNRRPASKMCDQSPLGVMLNFDARVKNSDAAQPRVTNVKTPVFFSTCLFSPKALQSTCGTFNLRRVARPWTFSSDPDSSQHLGQERSQGTKCNFAVSRWIHIELRRAFCGIIDSCLRKFLVSRLGCLRLPVAHWASC